MSNKYIFEIGGAIGLIGSLIFVGIEIRQNTTAVRGATQQAVSSQVAEMYRIGAENERMAELVSKAFQDISKTDISEGDYVSLWMYQMMGFRRIENIYLQYKNGLLTKDAFSRIGMGIYRTKIVREIWDERRGDFEPDFAEFFEELRDNNNYRDSDSNKRE
jgi:hypothetical protein